MIRLLDFNLKKIQYFLTTAEEGSMSKAAKVLYVSQPLLSKNIRELETELRVLLFLRDGKQLKLSDAGKYLYEQWSSLIKSMTAQMETAQSIAHSQRKHIHLGCEHIMALGANELWIKPLMQFQQSHKDVAVNMSSLGLKEIKEKLISGIIDLMICSSFDAESLSKEYHVRTLCLLPVYLYGRKEHPVLSKKEHVRWEDLKDCSFYTISPDIAFWPQELLYSYAHAAGFHPMIVGYTETQMSQLLKIKTSDCLMLSLELKTLIEDEMLCARQMAGKTEIVFVWRKGNPLLDDFVEELLVYCKTPVVTKASS